MGGENQHITHDQKSLLAQQSNYSSSSLNANSSSSSTNSSATSTFIGYGGNGSNMSMTNNGTFNMLGDSLNQQQQQYRNMNQGSQQQSLPNLDLNSILGINGDSSAVPSHLGHNGGQHLVTHMMGSQYNFNQPPQQQSAYAGPTHSVMPSIPIVPQQQQFSNNVYMNQQTPLINQPMMNGNNMMMNSNNNGMGDMGNGGNGGLDSYSQDVLLLVVEQQRRIYHLEEELQKAQEYINKLQEYARSLEMEKEKQSKKQSRYWTQQEHQKFLQGIEKYGRKDVKAISNFVGTRNPTQVRTHAQKYYAKVEREQRQQHSGDKRLIISGNSNSSGNESEEDIIDDDLVSDGSGSSRLNAAHNFTFSSSVTSKTEEESNINQQRSQELTSQETA